MAGRLKAVPRAIWTLGLVSLFMDVSSEMIHGLLPAFLVSGLGASVALVGVIEGIAEATASITKVFSGWLSDRIGRRKLLAVIGYGLAAATKPVFPLASTPMQVLAARFVDRIGKGVRDAPRDALVADLTPPALIGAAYGLRQALDTVGAFAGPLTAIGLMAVLNGNIRAVFAWAVVPGVVAVLLLAFGVREPRPSEAAPEAARAPIRWADVLGMGAGVWSVVALGVVFTLARFSDAFLVLRAQGVGLPLALVPAIMVVMNLVYAAVSAPAGALSDRIGRRALLAVGLGVLVCADLVLALFPTVPGALAGAALWGLHMGLTQGLFSALVADSAPARLRGTAFGVFNLAGGLAALAASAIAGAVWARIGPSATFLTGGGFALLTLIGLAVAAGRRFRAPSG
jgi:MFS family permease